MAKLRLIGIPTEMRRWIKGTARAQCVTYLADPRCQNPWQNALMACHTHSGNAPGGDVSALLVGHMGFHRSTST